MEAIVTLVGVVGITWTIIMGWTYGRVLWNDGSAMGVMLVIGWAGVIIGLILFSIANL